MSGAVTFANAVMTPHGGSLEIGAGATLSLLDGCSINEGVDFLAASGLLNLGNPSTFAGLIDGFGGTDTIDLLQTAETGYSVSHGVLPSRHGTVVAALRFEGSYTKSSFSLTSDGHDGTLIAFK